MSNQIYIDSDKETDGNQSENEEEITFGFGDIFKIILAMFSLTAPYLIAFMLLFGLAIALVLGYFLL